MEDVFKLAKNENKLTNLKITLVPNTLVFFAQLFQKVCNFKKV